MGWITWKNKRQPGWLALVPRTDEIDLVHVARGADGTPRVLMCDSVANDDSHAATLARLAKELKLERYRCTTLLPREAYQLHQIEPPAVPAAELKQAVRWKVKDLIEYGIESATVDVLDIPADTHAPSPDHAVYAVTAPNAAIERWAEPFASARVTLESIDIPELAQRNVAALFEEDDGGVVTLAFHQDDGLLTFTRRGELYNARRIDVSLPQLVAADDARRSAYFERIALEVQRSLDHLERQYAYVPLMKLLLGPLPPQLRLDGYLSSMISVPLESIDLADVLDLAAAPALHDVATQSKYFEVIGAALRDEEGVTA